MLLDHFDGCDVVMMMMTFHDSFLLGEQGRLEHFTILTLPKWAQVRALIATATHQGGRPLALHTCVRRAGGNMYFYDRYDMIR